MIYIDSIRFKKEYTPFSIGDEFHFEEVNLLVGDQGAGKSTMLHLLHNAKNKNIIRNKVNEIFSTDEATATSAKKVFNPAFLQDKGIAAKISENGLAVETNGLFDEYCEIYDIVHSDKFSGNLRFLDTEAHNPRIKYTEYESKRPLMQELSIICREIHRAVQNEKAKKHVREIFAEYAAKSDAQHKDLDGFIINSHRSHGETILPMLSELTKCSGIVILLDEPETSLSIKSQFKLAEIIHDIKNNGNQLFIATHSPILMNAHGVVLSLEHREWMKADDFISTQKV